MRNRKSQKKRKKKQIKKEEHSAFIIMTAMRLVTIFVFKIHVVRYQDKLQIT